MSQSPHPIPETLALHWRYVVNVGWEPKPAYILRNRETGEAKGWSLHKGQMDRIWAAQNEPERWMVEKRQPEAI